jgi:chromosome partitioning protein
MNTESRFVSNPVTLNRIFEIQENASMVLEAARERMLEPHPRKRPPVYTGLQVSQLCGITKARLNYLVSRPNSPLPSGRLEGKNRMFTLEEARHWVREVGVDFVPRPEHAEGFVISCSNLKGGSTKTTTALQCAQGLSLRGRKVLLVDTDSQCSLTTLCDRLPESEVSDDDTIIPFMVGDQPDLKYAVKPTYWDGVDLIPANFSVFHMEVVLPIQASEDPEFEFWAMLERGLKPLKKDYDVIILDTPPSLSYLTFNAIYAANGILMPLPPEAIDFASSAMFWRLFADLFRIANLRRERQGKEPVEKVFDFVNVLLSKVNTQNASTSVVREWISAAYEELVLPVEIPVSGVTTGTASKFGSIYDLAQYKGDRRTYGRIREACDRVVELVDQQIVTSWMRKD